MVRIDLGSSAIEKIGLLRKGSYFIKETDLVAITSYDVKTLETVLIAKAKELRTTLTVTYDPLHRGFIVDWTPDEEAELVN